MRLQVPVGHLADVMREYSPIQESEQKLFTPLTPEQCRAARAILNWTQAELAEKAQVGRSKLRSFEGEKGLRAVTESDLQAISSALQAAGIVLIPENEVHLAGAAPKR